MANPAIAIIDSGGANSGQHNAFRTADTVRIRCQLRMRAQALERIHERRNVGAARDAMSRLTELGLIDVIRGLSQPVLGICLGMQLLAEASEEEDVECLGVIPGVARKLEGSTDCPVPNMGWCPIEARQSHAVLTAIDDGSYFYFVHSYALPVAEHTLAIASHAEPFSAMVRRDNFVASQFHPERSSTNGSRLLANFVGLSS